MLVIHVIVFVLAILYKELKEDHLVRPGTECVVKADPVVACPVRGEPRREKRSEVNMVEERGQR